MGHIVFLYSLGNHFILCETLYFWILTHMFQYYSNVLKKRSRYYGFREAAKEEAISTFHASAYPNYPCSSNANINHK